MQTFCFFFSPPLLMRQLLHHSSETPLHQCISHRHTNHKNVKEVTAKHILPRLYNFFVCVRVYALRKKQGKSNTRVTEMPTHRVGISEETAKYFSLQPATLDAII